MTSHRTSPFSPALAALLLAAATSLIALSAGGAMAQAKPELVGSFAKWELYTLGDGDKKSCYIASAPTDWKANKPNVKRGPIFFLVTFRPSENVKNEVSVAAGYPFKDDSTVAATVDATEFTMYTDGEGAWLADRNEEARMVKTMKVGAKLVVVGESGRGTQTTDTYSLDGVTAALEALEDKCK